jgi:hypothetical protein
MKCEACGKTVVVGSEYYCVDRFGDCLCNKCFVQAVLFLTKWHDRRWEGTQYSPDGDSRRGTFHGEPRDDLGKEYELIFQPCAELVN